ERVGVEGHLPERDPAGDDLRVRPGRTREGERAGQAEAGQPGRRKGADLVLLAGVVVDVQDVDLLTLGRLRGDAGQGGIDLTGEDDRLDERAVLAGRASLDLQRAPEVVQQMGT